MAIFKANGKILLSIKLELKYSGRNIILARYELGKVVSIFNNQGFNRKQSSKILKAYSETSGKIYCSGFFSIARKMDSLESLYFTTSFKNDVKLETKINESLTFKVDGKAFVKRYLISQNGLIKSFNLSGFNVNSSQNQTVVYGNNLFEMHNYGSFNILAFAKPTDVKFNFNITITQKKLVLTKLKYCNFKTYSDIKIESHHQNSENYQGFLPLFNRNKFNVKLYNKQKLINFNDGVKINTCAKFRIIRTTETLEKLKLSTIGSNILRGNLKGENAELKLENVAILTLKRYSFTTLGFNQMYNRSKFNTREHIQVKNDYGMSSVGLATNGICRSVIKSSGISMIRVLLNLNSRQFVKAKLTKINFKIHINKPKINRGKRVKIDSNLYFKIAPIHFYISKSEFIFLGGITIKPDDVLKIDTENCTIFLNGVNMLEYLTDDSLFFRLQNGENHIIIEDSSHNRNAEIKTMWRNRYL